MGMRQPRSPTVIPFPSRERPHYSCRSKDERAGSILPPQPAAPAGTAAPGTLLSPGSSSMPTCTETSASGLALSTAPGAAGRYGQPVPARHERIQEEQGYARRQQESLAQAPEQAEGTRGGAASSAPQPWQCQQAMVAPTVPPCRAPRAAGCSTGHLHPCLRQKHPQSTECGLWGAVSGRLSTSFLKGIVLSLTLLLGCACPFPDCVSSAKTSSFASFSLLGGLHTAELPKGREEQQQDQITPCLPQGQLFWER